jgi:uncharacterized repeat protein (TIGR01451 family)
MVQAANSSLDYLTPPSHKIPVAQDGIYEITYGELEAAGLPVDDLDPRTFQLFNMGSEVAIYVDGEDDGSFDAPAPANLADEGDYILFYGQKMNTKYTDTNVYWLRYGDTNGLRMQTKDGTPAGADDPLIFKHTVHLEEDHQYSSSLPMQAAADHWYWDFWYTGLVATRSYETILAHISTGTHTCTLRAVLQGFSQDNHQIELSVNGSLVGTAEWNGESAYSGEFTFQQSLLMEGPNEIELHAPTVGLGKDSGYTNWFEMEYYDTFTAEGDRLRFNGDLSGTQSISYTYHVAGFNSPDVDAFDVTIPAHPQRITGATVAGSSPYTLTFQDTISERTEYLALTPAQRLSPIAVELDVPSYLRAQTNAADYIAITHGDFYTDVIPLADHRAAQGMRTVVVDVEETYDEFSYGVFDPRAIHDFLAHAYANWDPPAPTYVLLVGDGHYDFKDNLETGSRNYVPPYLAMVDPYMGETATDNRYVTVSGADIVPDMHVGRLPVNSRAEAQAMVNKILDYEQNPPADDWISQVLFVADDQPDDAGDFWDLSEDIATHYLPDVYTSTKVYYDKQSGDDIPGHPEPPRPQPPYYANNDNARATIVAAINQGHLLANYIGHGAPQQWAREKLFRLEDIATLTNGGRLPMMLPWTCREGYFIFPQSHLACMGESIVRANAKGAIASWSPTGFGTCAGHHYLNRGFFNAVFQDDVREIGPATTLGKLFLWNNTLGNRDLMDTYVLFGDPALRLNTLPADVALTKSVDPIGSVQPGDALTYTLTYTNAGPATAHHVVISDVLPTALISPTVTASGAAITLQPGTRFVWDVEDLAEGEGGLITITAILDPTAAGVITNSATIATSAWETDTQNNATDPLITDVDRPVGGTTYLPIVGREFRHRAYLSVVASTLLSILAGVRPTQ